MRRRRRKKRWVRKIIQRKIVEICSVRTRNNRRSVIRWTIKDKRNIRRNIGKYV